MILFALGINHHNADVSLREQFAFSPREAPQVLAGLMQQRAVEEAVVLSTCNRTEIYTMTLCHHAVRAWFLQQHQLSKQCAAKVLYEHQDTHAVRHLMSVASGLDSMMLGEPQIFGQVKQAYQLAQQESAVGPQLQQLFPAVFSVAKEIRTDTGVGCQPVSMNYAVLQLAKRIFTSLQDRTVLLIGAGETIEQMANYLQQHQVKCIYVANRTLERAQILARQCQGIPIRFEEIADYLAQADIVISATSSRAPILQTSVVAEIQRQRQYRPLFISDLAVPRDVEETVGKLDNVYLYNVDDLEEVVTSAQQSRQVAAKQARHLIDEKAQFYARQLRVLDAGDMIRDFRQKMEQWRDQELSKALKSMQKTGDAEAVMTGLARNLTNKFMHLPTTKLREAAAMEHVEFIALLKELYEIV